MSFTDSTFSLQVRVPRALEEGCDDAHVALLHQLLVDLAQRRRLRRVGGVYRALGVAVHETARVEHRGVAHDAVERAEVVGARIEIAPERTPSHHVVHAAWGPVGEHLDLSTCLLVALLHQLRHLVGVERLLRVRHANVCKAKLRRCT